MALYAFDGTWNYRDQKEPIKRLQSLKYGPDRSFGRDTDETNVSRFFEFNGGGENGHYIQGVGTRFWWLGRVFGGGFGAGGKRRIRRMYRALMERYHLGGDHDIDIIGFSRGAALAVHFANVIENHGVRDPRGYRHAGLWYYRDLGWTWRFPLPSVSPTAAPPVAFLGLWETVATFGWPFRPFRNKSWTWNVERIPEIVSYCFHALSLDEVRATFELVRPVQSRERQLYEVWFRGVHANIGGGYVERGLSDIALAWMMVQAKWTWMKFGREVPKLFDEALSQLSPDAPEEVEWTGTSCETLAPDPNGPLGRPKDVHRQGPRELGDDPKVHHSVYLRNTNLVADHHGRNQRLVRRVPENARPTFDPPIFYGGRVRDLLREAALTAFARVPPLPAEWLMLGGDFVFRSDDWIALGPLESRIGLDREKMRKLRKWKIDARVFKQVAAFWFERGRSDQIKPSEVTAVDKDGNQIEVTAKHVGACVQVLEALAPYLPAAIDDRWPAK